MTECVPSFRSYVVQKRVPDACAALALSSNADLSVREKAAQLVVAWAALAGAPRAFADALEALRLEGVPLDNMARGFDKWARTRDEQLAAAAASSTAARRLSGGALRLERDLLLPVGKDGRQRGREAEEAEEEEALAGHRSGRSASATARWNAAGRPARAGPEGNDRFRTGTAASGSDDDERAAPAGLAAHHRHRSGRSSPPSGSFVTPGMSADMAEAAMVQEMLALDLKDEGEALLSGGDLEGALAAYTNALEYAPNYRVYAARAACLLRLGRAAAAADDATRLVAMLPSFAAGHALLAQALEAQRRFADARSAYEKACFLAQADGDDDAMEVRAQYPWRACCCVLTRARLPRRSTRRAFSACAWWRARTMATTDWRPRLTWRPFTVRAS